MDLEPFSRINPCGLLGMQVTQLADLLETPVDMGMAKSGLLAALARSYGLSPRRLDNLLGA